MTATSPSDGVAAPPALAAFLRGIERRAAVLADLQSGRPERGTPALAAAMRAFRSHAAALPMADWPLRFWKLLGAVPTLRQADAAAGAWPAPLAHLRTLQPADRLALLLRIVAGLDEPLAAQVLQLSTEDYQQALARACPRDAAGRPDAAGWRALADAAQQCLRDLPPARLQALAQLRDAAIAGSTAPPAATPAPATDTAPARPRRRGARSALRTRLAGAVIAVVVLALVGTAFWDRLPWRRAHVATGAGGTDAGLALGDTGPVQVEVLPPESDTASAPPLPADPPAPLPEPAIYDLDFYAWYAAGAPPPRIERSAPSAADLAEAAEHPPAAAVAPAVAPAAASTPPALTPAQLHARQAAWDALPAAAQARLRQVATAFAGLPIEQQHSLHAQFAEMDALERHGWLLGPELGAEFWALQPLLGYVPAAQRQALLGVLRSLPADQREHLALLSQRTPPQDRAALRRDLLAQGADSRGAWLKQRAAR
ncbi:hypothetical protein [Xanthomonas sp. CFBP 8445]|uniref:hypothetical protein n=1 Tax=Xanthomonas sp. CFBP 8445 TaxID=2971236 RepID=UPI0021E0E68D|nr:hypothetical protein [Xanthomonas sp. CFBP 8445]UYC12806.1 hypothetical protein NUG21_03415 [Xanthomonas sp. CFBP 8445]